MVSSILAMTARVSSSGINPSLTADRRPGLLATRNSGVPFSHSNQKKGRALGDSSTPYHCSTVSTANQGHHVVVAEQHARRTVRGENCPSASKSWATDQDTKTKSGDDERLASLVAQHVLAHPAGRGQGALAPAIKQSGFRQTSSTLHPSKKQRMRRAEELFTSAIGNIWTGGRVAVVDDRTSMVRLSYLQYPVFDSRTILCDPLTGPEA